MKKECNCPDALHCPAHPGTLCSGISESTHCRAPGCKEDHFIGEGVIGEGVTLCVPCGSAITAAVAATSKALEDATKAGYASPLSWAVSVSCMHTFQAGGENRDFLQAAAAMASLIDTEAHNIPEPHHEKLRAHGLELRRIVDCFGEYAPEDIKPWLNLRS